MSESIVDRSGRHLIVGTGPCAERLIRRSKDERIELEQLESAEVRAVEPAPDGRWWVGLAAGERRLYQGVIVVSEDSDFVAAEVTGAREQAPHLAAGLVPTGYLNIYFLQPPPENESTARWLDRAAQLVVELIRIQPALDYPAGALLQRMGMRAPMPWWQHALLGGTEIRISSWLVRRLPAVQAELMQGHPRTARIRALSGLLGRSLHAEDRALAEAWLPAQETHAPVLGQPDPQRS